MGIIAVFLSVADRGQPPTGAVPTLTMASTGLSPAAIMTAAAAPSSLLGFQAVPHLVFQNVVRGDDYAKVSLATLDAPDAGRIATRLVCERVHFASGQGLCLAARHGAESSYFAVLFGSDFEARASIPLDGLPNLTRVSPDGRYGAASVITSPASELADSTNTTLLIDMANDSVMANLEDFTLTRDGAQVEAADLDFWGVSFSAADSDRFYATVRTSGNHYLVDGSITTREMRVLQPNVSAPSISSDGTRIVYAKLMSNIGPTWRFHVLDLSTMVETALAETASIDDQVEWVDDAHVLYGLAGDMFVVPADGTGAPHLFLEDGLSPAVVRSP